MQTAKQEIHTIPGVTIVLAAGQTITNGMPVTFAGPGDVTHVYLEAVGNGTATVTFSFIGTGNAGGLNHADSITVTAYAQEFRQVTTEATPEGVLYNPCGIAEGGTARFQMSFLPESIPGSKIVWSNAYGHVSFPEGNTGRTVTVKGEAAGAFRLEVEVEGILLSPYAEGEVKLMRDVDVTVLIVRDDNGQNAAYTEDKVQSLITGLNKIYRQPAMTFRLAGEINYTNRTDWLNLTRTDGIWPDNDGMRRTLPRHGSQGLKLIFVNTIASVTTATSVTNALGGNNNPYGTIVAAGHASPRVVGHEFGHACGLRDIFVEDGRTPLKVTGEMDLLRMPADWGGGYYPPGLMQADLIKQLLMYGWVEEGAGTDIPTGSIYGVWHDLLNGVWKLDLAPVGLDNLERDPDRINHK